MYREKLDEIAEQAVQLTITSIIIIHTHAPLYNLVLLLQITTCNDTDGEHNYLWSDNVVQGCG